MSWRQTFYEVNSPEQGTLEFQTDFGLTYKILFVSAKAYFPNRTWSENVYSVIFECQGQRVYDPKVLPTIVAYVYFAIADNPNVVLMWVCDTTDNQHHARFRLFNKWCSHVQNMFDVPEEEFDEIPHLRWSYTKRDGLIGQDDTIHYASVVVHNDNIHKEEILEVFAQEVQELAK